MKLRKCHSEYFKTAQNFNLTCTCTVISRINIPFFFNAQLIFLKRRPRQVKNVEAGAIEINCFQRYNQNLLNVLQVQCPVEKSRENENSRIVTLQCHTDVWTTCLNDILKKIFAKKTSFEFLWFFWAANCYFDDAESKKRSRRVEKERERGSSTNDVRKK